MNGRHFDPKHDTQIVATDGRVYAYGPRVDRSDSMDYREHIEPPPKAGVLSADFWCVFYVNFYDNAGHWIDHWKADCDTETTARLLAETLAATGSST